MDRRAARVLVDAGGGTFERLGRAGVEAANLDLVLLTHTHIDHSGGLPPVVFAAFMAGRERPLTVVGPAAGLGQPGNRRFCDLLFGPEGAWNYLHSFPGFGVDALEAPSDSTDAQVSTVTTAADLTVRSVAVPHGIMPSVAYRIDAGDTSVVITGDVSQFHPPLIGLAQGVSLLVHDMALPERPTPHGHLHAKPQDVGRHAAGSHARSLLLTHVMPELEDERAAAEAGVRRHFSGPLDWAHDLMTVPISSS
ncbi:MAG: MBL fold metallo-hydrolase [Dermatophilaceae bacterium]